MRKEFFTMILRIVTPLLALLCFSLASCDSETVEPVDCNANPVSIETIAVQNSNCELSDGSIEVAASGGTAPYRYSLNGGTMGSTAVFEGLAAGTYEITAMDANDCSNTLEVNVQNDDGVNMTFTTEESGCGTSQGSISVQANGGAAPYQFKLDGGSFSSSSVFSNLSRGDHELVVTDASGCSIEQTVKIKSGVSFNNSISSIISGNCAVSGCHNGSQPPDLRTAKAVRDNAGQIKTLTGNKTMPKNGTLTQEQIDLIACWVDDGAPDN